MMELVVDGPTQTGYDVLLQGNGFCDLTFAFTDRDRMPELGQEVFAGSFGMSPGGIFNVVAALTQLGVSVGWRTELGNDIFSRFVADQMATCGVSRDLTTWRDEPLPVVTASISFPHDRLFISYHAPRAGGVSLTREDLHRYRPRVLFTYGEVGPAMMRAAREQGVLVYLDTYWNSEHLRSSYLREILEHVDIFAPNEAEALEMTGSGTLDEAIATLRTWCRCGAVKCGERGCVAWRGDERFDVPAIAVDTVETTGAGDNFNAGLIFGLLREWPFLTCLRAANIVGALSTLSLGGCGSGVTAEELDRRLRSARWHPECEVSA